VRKEDKMTSRRMLLSVPVRIRLPGDRREREDESMATRKIRLCSLHKMNHCGHLSGIHVVGNVLYPLYWIPGLKVISLVVGESKVSSNGGQKLN
jgi:hypothetical protein